MGDFRSQIEIIGNRNAIGDNKQRNPTIHAKILDHKAKIYPTRMINSKKNSLNPGVSDTRKNDQVVEIGNPSA